jgi:hypothetical protein
MKKNDFTFYIVMMIFAGLLLSGACRPKQSYEGEKESDWKILIISDIEEERTSAPKEVLGKRRKTIEYLLSVVNSAVEEGEPFYSSTTSRNIAISLLGKLRAKEAVASLVNWLSPKPGQFVKIGELLMFSPAGYALIEIGLPSVPPLFHLLKAEGNVALREQCIKIIVRIKGLPETELLLEDILTKETDNSKRENLKSAQDLLKNPKFRKILENI